MSEEELLEGIALRAIGVENQIDALAEIDVWGNRKEWDDMQLERARRILDFVRENDVTY